MLGLQVDLSQSSSQKVSIGQTVSRREDLTEFKVSFPQERSSEVEWFSSRVTSLAGFLVVLSGFLRQLAEMSLLQ